MNRQQEWDYNFGNGRSGGDWPGADASNRAWDAFNAGRDQRSLEKACEMLQRRYDEQNRTSAFNFD